MSMSVGYVAGNRVRLIPDLPLQALHNPGGRHSSLFLYRLTLSREIYNFGLTRGYTGILTRAIG